MSPSSSLLFMRISYFRSLDMRDLYYIIVIILDYTVRYYKMVISLHNVDFMNRH